MYYSLKREPTSNGLGSHLEPIGLDASNDEEALSMVCGHLEITGELTEGAFKAAGGDSVIRWNGDKPLTIFPA